MMRLAWESRLTFTYDEDVTDVGGLSMLPRTHLLSRGNKNVATCGSELRFELSTCDQVTQNTKTEWAKKQSLPNPTVNLQYNGSYQMPWVDQTSWLTWFALEEAKKQT